MFGALAVAAGFFLFGAPAANAYTINCTDVPSSLTTYPYDGYAKKCGTVSTQRSVAMAGAIWDMTSIAADAYSELDAANVPFHMFKNPSEYNTYVSERSLGYPAVTSATVFGVTVKDGSGVPVFTAIFDEDTTGQSITTHYTVAFITVHEAGHSVDYRYHGLGNDSYELSASQMFKDLLAKDWDNFNQLPPCGVGGIFNGRKSFNGLWICSGVAHDQMPVTNDFTPGDNQTILQAAAGDHYLFDREIFSNLVSRLSGNSSVGQVGVSSYLDGSRFGCTKLFVGEVIQSGTVPTATEMSAVAKTGGGAGSANCPTSGSGWSLP